MPLNPLATWRWKSASPSAPRQSLNLQRFKAAAKPTALDLVLGYSAAVKPADDHDATGANLSTPLALDRSSDLQTYRRFVS